LGAATERSGVMTVEVNSGFQRKGPVFMTPPLDANYWLARVVLHADQAIVIFPKFYTIGCGFALEEDWNTNLPIRMKAKAIYDHIAHNKKYSEITEEQCLEAIRMLQRWVEEMEKQL
jgi:hypothetical protein